MTGETSPSPLSSRPRQVLRDGAPLSVRGARHGRDGDGRADGLQHEQTLQDRSPQ